VASCSQPPPDNSPDPCAVLSTECPYCSQPGPKETCTNAAVTGDDVQCTVALDDPGVVADCVVPDGGGDATLEGGAEASMLPMCNTTQALPEAGCSCAPPCATTCPTGGCDITCPAGGICAPSCDGGHCTIHCESGATCDATCNGGDCIFTCAAGSTCNNTCAAGGCAFQCADDSVCNDMCPPAPRCTGP
jgi:hypothetical protein